VERIVIYMSVSSYKMITFLLNIYFKGIFNKNYLDGFGFSKGNSECSYLGEWKNSKQHGFGVEVWTNGSLYKGEFQLGKKHGIGSYIWANGAVYTGQWEKNKIDGNVR